MNRRNFFRSLGIAAIGAAARVYAPLALVAIDGDRYRHGAKMVLRYVPLPLRHPLPRSSFRAVTDEEYREMMLSPDPLLQELKWKEVTE